MKKYRVIFEDIFSFALCQRDVSLSDSQLKTALKQKQDKVIVVDKLDKFTKQRDQLILKSITLIK